MFFDRKAHTPPSASPVAGLALISCLFVVFVVAGLLLGAGTSVAQDTPPLSSSDAGSGAKGEVAPSYKKAVRAYLAAQGIFEGLGLSMAYGAANETLSTLANSGIEITETMQQIVREEAMQTYADKFSGIDLLTDLWAPVYSNHFTEAEVNEMTAFWDSPIGKKSLEMIPIINQESMLALQEVRDAITPGFQLAVDARFREAGVNLVAP